MLSVGGFAVYRSVTRGAEGNAMKSNIDRVAISLENYWQQYALNSDGTRDFDMSEACPWLNSQHGTGNDLVIRTLNGQNAIATRVFVEDIKPAVGGTTGANDGAVALCPVSADEARKDGDASKPDIKVTAATAALSDWQKVGLGSTRGVWIMQPAGRGPPEQSCLMARTLFSTTRQRALRRMRRSFLAGCPRRERPTVS